MKRIAVAVFALLSLVASADVILETPTPPAKKPVHKAVRKPKPVQAATVPTSTTDTTATTTTVAKTTTVPETTAPVTTTTATATTSTALAPDAKPPRRAPMWLFLVPLGIILIAVGARRKREREGP